MKSLELLKNEINLQLFNELFDNSNEYSISFFYNSFVKNPKETLYHVCSLLDKNLINEELFFQIIDSFIAKKNYEKFLLEYLFLSFKPLNDYITFKIENSLFFKVKKFFNSKHKNIQTIKRSIFDSYYSNNQIDDAISFAKSNSLDLDYFLLDTYGKGTPNFNETKHYKLNQLIVCSAFTNNYKDLFNYFFSYIPYTFESFKYQQINYESLQCKLKDIESSVKYAAYMIYKNTIFNRINQPIETEYDRFRYRSTSLDTETILLFLLSHDLFSDNEIELFFLYVNQYINLQQHFSDAYLHSFNTKNLNILSHFIYLSMKYNQKHIFLKLNKFFSNENLNSQFILRTFLLFSKEDYTLFNSFNNKKQILKAIDHFFWSFDYQNNTFNTNPTFDLKVFNSFTFFYQENLISTFLEHLKYLDDDIYQQVIELNKKNLFIIKHYFKIQIENF